MNESVPNQVQHDGDNNELPQDEAGEAVTGPLLAITSSLSSDVGDTGKCDLVSSSSSSDEEFECRDEECKPSEDDNQYELQDGNISNPAAPPPPEEEEEKSVDILLDEEQIIYSDVIFSLQRQMKDGKNANLSNSQNEKNQEFLSPGSYCYGRNSFNY